MKKKVLIVCLCVVFLLIAGVITFVVWAVSAPGNKDNPQLRITLENVYSDYLKSIEKEDRLMLLSVLTTERVRDLTKTFELNRMKFPDDYFEMFKRYSPKLPPCNLLRYVAVTESDKYANLIYVGNLKGYLRKVNDEQEFFIIQFEKEGGNWKYSVCVDQPTDIVPDLEQRLAKGQLYFLKFKPFTAEKLELKP